jgi:hypothetical protein
VLQERKLARSLLGSGQGYIFKAWPKPGETAAPFLAAVPLGIKHSMAKAWSAQQQQKADHV